MSEHARPFIIRRKKIIHAHHGGSWKIALADFMTALMALFLVLWLLSTASKSELEGVAEYFSTPLMVAITGGDGLSMSRSVIPGGGTDPIHMDGEQVRIDLRQESRPAEVRRSFLELQRRIEAVIQADAELRDLREQMRFYIVPEGLLIQLVDTERRPMFQRGSDQVEVYMQHLLRSIAPLLNELPNRISISGHTDNLPYPGDNPGYSNWELSTDRANASRRELLKGGLDANKLLRVVGMAERMPISRDNPRDPVNRRIEVIVLAEDGESPIAGPKTAGDLLDVVPGFGRGEFLPGIVPDLMPRNSAARTN
ncbi:MAG: flagellar motor protein MotB [Pseudomonadales bacterium]|nr:flagellar motor protein MotB [Pseudomonadales bacterium]